jgi:uncharacterized protein (TIGR03000 family)
MYSIVLATMLTAGTATPAWGHGCHGCFGCYGCSGCYGCYCCGGCYGGYGYGYGCYCCGGCYGCGGYGYGCYCCGGCYGCYGCGGCYGYAAPATAAPAKAAATTPPAEGKVVVDVPSDATLYIDGQKSKMTSGRRTFVSPVLQGDATYFYDLTAEVVRDGEKKTETRRVMLRAGQVSRVDFRDLGLAEEPVAAAAAAPAIVTVRVPEKARLLIDGKATSLTSNVRKFETPTLTPGKTYYYTLTAEVDRDGETLSQTRRVLLQAGKKVSVTFDQLKPAATDTASR